MKKFNLLILTAIALLFTLNVNAQTPDYFPGKWIITVMGTPNGDSKMTFVLERKEGKLAGVVQDSTGKEITKITQIDEKGKTITAAFTVENYDVNLLLEPIDDDHVKGSLLGMFEAKGIRVKDTDPTKK